MCIFILKSCLSDSEKHFLKSPGGLWVLGADHVKAQQALQITSVFVTALEMTHIRVFLSDVSISMTWLPKPLQIIVAKTEFLG